VADLLSDQWFEDLNVRLAATPLSLPDDARACVIVLEVSDAPPSGARAITLRVDADGARIAPGDTPGADAVVRLGFADAAALAAGELDSATALREGRLKVRGDVNALVPLAGWLHSLLSA
jgi:hypothetical protein